MKPNNPTLIDNTNIITVFMFSSMRQYKTSPKWEASIWWAQQDLQLRANESEKIKPQAVTESISDS
ncbi:hypothetical protein ACLBSJ_33245, partial [Klebsiella pneumoniae]|uniref:hypothetical protein n=1 Tax=Klebsiella pneumoniae TaxID=573 RepID=UPI0039680021